jgi:hypothetical protein
MYLQYNKLWCIIRLFILLIQGRVDELEYLFMDTSIRWVTNSWMRRDQWALVHGRVDKIARH